MEIKANLISVDRMYDGKYRLTFESDEMPNMEELKDKTLRLFAKAWKNGRSLDANGYYWVLQGQLAESIKVSKSFMHNQLLRRYGQIAIYGDQAVYVVIPNTDEASKKVDEDEHVHLKPTSQIKEGKDGRMYRTYMLLKGSHEYNTAEFSALLDGLISECKEVGIPTDTPEEIQRMKELYGIRYEKKNKITAI